MFSAQDVKELRERTGCGMMDCKKALTETGGDMDKAIEVLREKGLAKAAKKAGRVAAEGLVEAKVIDGVAVAVEVNSETDFVAKNEIFQNFVSDIANNIAKNDFADLDALMASTLPDGKTVDESLKEKIATIGENMAVRRFARFDGAVQAYVHGAGKIGVLVKFDLSDPSKKDTDAFKAYAKDVAMQVAAAYPQYLNKDQVPADTLEKEKEILRAQALNEGKPEAIVDKMVMGRISKFYKEVCLVEQPFIKDQDKTVTGYTNEVGKALGTDIKIVDYVRFEKGEGIEKKEDNFAEEIANMVK